jgi:hypothetical protein
MSQVIHLAHAYQHSVFTTRFARSRSMLLSRAGSVSSAAGSSIGCTFILMFCQMQLFPAFGRIVIVTIACSVLCSLFFFAPLVMAVGPHQRKRLQDYAANGAPE